MELARIVKAVMAKLGWDGLGAERIGRKRWEHKRSQRSGYQRQEMSGIEMIGEIPQWTGSKGTDW